ncbi:MAG: hypothetical protein JRE23_14065 [Deltaproteobacteria bacterium]|nr:hypothetical protein [Deltaproteobacteria bacterium]
MKPDAASRKNGSYAKVSIVDTTAIGKDHYFTSVSNALTGYAIGLDNKWLDTYVQQ